MFKRRSLVTGLVLLLSLALAVGLAFSAKVKVTTTVDIYDQGKINWEVGVVKATGMGAPPSGMPQGQARMMARRAAIVDCYRNLAEIVYGVRVDSETLVRNFVTESDVIETKVTGMIKGAQIVSDKQMPDGSYEVIMVIPLYGKESVGNIILPEAISQQKVKMEEAGKEIIPLPPAPEVPLEGSYTGLIIDARGKGVEPCMSPKIISEDGDEVYGTMKVDPEIVIEKGIIGYAHSMGKAKQSWRAGDHPLIIEATGKCGTFKADVLVTQKDAQRIKEANREAGFLQNLRVTIVS